MSLCSGGEGSSIDEPPGVAAGDSKQKGTGVRIRGLGCREKGLLLDEVEGVMKTEDWGCSGVARDFSIEAWYRHCGIDRAFHKSRVASHFIA